jgi:hypothetical protein
VVLLLGLGEKLAMTGNIQHGAKIHPDIKEQIKVSLSYKTFSAVAYTNIEKGKKELNN